MPHSLAASVDPAPVQSFYPTRDERNELAQLAVRVARLTISRTNPHEFFEERSELVFALRNLAKGGGQNRRSGVNIS
jgi:hypothetical protein